MVAMFRLGLFCYLPVYILFPTLRVLLLEHTTWPVFIGMVVLSAIRYLANTCAVRRRCSSSSLTIAVCAC